MREGEKGKGKGKRTLGPDIRGCHTLLLKDERSSIYHSVSCCSVSFRPLRRRGLSPRSFCPQPHPPCLLPRVKVLWVRTLTLGPVVAFRRRDKVHQYICYERGKFSVLYLPLKPKIVMRNTCPVQGQRECYPISHACESTYCTY